MNIVLWMLTGGFVGWVGYAYLGLNQGRGKRISLIIGAVGGFSGGQMVAPMFAAVAVPAVFSAPALFFAAGAAAAFLVAGNVLYDLWGV